MNQKVLKTLEFHKILEQLASHAGSDGGRKLCLALLPSCDCQAIEVMQTQTKDALTRLFRSEAVSFSGIKDVTPSVKRLDMGSSLSIEELLGIAGLLEAARRVKSYSAKENDTIPDDSLTELFDLLMPLTPISSEIRRCILSEDEISDEASAALKQVRRNMRLTNDKIHSQLSQMVSSSYKSYLQDAVITMRNDRYCLPIKAEYKTNVQGMIHDQSASGSTLFIEPAAIVKLNNDLKELHLQEAKEIEIILATLSAKCGEVTEQITLNYQTLIQLDFIFAKAALAMEQNANIPILNTEGRIVIRQGRHPLLNQKAVVPTDIHLGKDFDLLVITGPNTGGKTVALKTVGLLSLMGQSGLHIPALDRSEIAIFTEIFADIGDEQSIEQSLSTFSSHMTNTVSILQNADEQSLCLFDELGAGTDPTEGAALAIAILTDLHERNIRTMATTHYSELKLYALSIPGVENASCEFNVETLRPTYRLLIGIPGKSNAFAISSKLGLPDYIIDSARTHLNEQDESFEDILSKLEANRVIIEKEKLEIEQYKHEVEALKEELKKKQEKLDAAKDKIIAAANEEARDILQDAKDLADETIKNFQKYGSGKGTIQDMERAREKVRSKITKSGSSLSVKSEEGQRKQYKAADFKLGESVKVLSMGGLTGTINSLPDAKGNVFVQCGILRSSINIKDLEIIDTPDITGPGMKRYQSGGKGKMDLSKSSAISTEINLLGLTVDEAIAKLDKYLDDAYLSHLPNVRIVHGKGTGALRSGIHSYLKRVKYVKEFHIGAFGEGDAGVTIVTFQ